MAFVGRLSRNAPAAVSAIEAKLADAVAFGRMFIANPGLPQRIRAGVPLNAFERSTAYGGGAHGYSFLAKAAGPFFCDDRRVLSVQPRQPFPVPWLGPLSSPRPLRPADAAEGGPSVRLRFDLPDGRVVRAEIAARLYVMTGRMIGARYPFED
jgi:hypothetical protein